MRSLSQLLEQAKMDRVAIGHFNVSDMVLLKAVCSSAMDLQVPVLVGVSEGERRFLGTRQIAALVRSLREEFGFPIFLNADHAHSLESAVEAARCGFDAVTFDRSAQPLEQNIFETQLAIQTLKAINPAILVEGEIGDIGTGSEIHEAERQEPRTLTTAQEARQFVEATGVDILAPAVGNSHGLMKSMVWGTAKKHLDVPLIAEIKRAVRIPLTLHGGSGTDDEDLREAIGAGVTIVHINTELRVAWRRGLEAGLSEDINQVVPYKILPSAVEAVSRVARSRMQLFNNGRLGFSVKSVTETAA
ncbi:fructose-bisphosphate aldolase, class II [Bryocella elongata]|uniref:Fructose-bisphosphate aldolase, class II n=1 Tax=Bryocella elongata TaxID=863522 RepID=A0A1H5UWZ1_9BACT|nr:class II fructose-bisphosphate aldolase [Bryocella elongata]SEF78938.1 fructose-bisphosphate aldolase, class II [Bryocella elongata]